MKRLTSLALLLSMHLCVIGQQFLYPTQPRNSGCFGWSIDAKDDLLIVGAYGESGTAGAAYIYRITQDTYGLEQRITAQTEPTWFGYSVGIEKDIAICSRGADNSTNARSSHIFRRHNGTWEHETQIRVNQSYFGSNVDISRNQVLIGAMLGRTPDNYAPGRAFIYEFDSTRWNRSGDVIPSDAKSAQTYFGESVELSFKKAFIGAYGEGNYQGAVYVYEFQDSVWVEKQKLSAPDGDRFYAFGDEIDFDGNTLVIGASRDGEVAEDGGAAYVYAQEQDSFRLIQKIAPRELNSKDRFGRSVSVFDEYLAIGASRSDLVKEDAGVAYLYRLQNEQWVFQRHVKSNDFTIDARFGTSVSVTDAHVIVGGYNHFNNEKYSGAVYIEQLD